MYHLLRHTGFWVSHPLTPSWELGFVIEEAGVGARGSGVLHRDIASLGGILNGLVGQTAAIITGLRSFH